MDAKGSSAEAVSVIDVMSPQTRNTMGGVISLRRYTAAVALAVLIVGVVVSAAELERSPVRTKLFQVMNEKSIASNTWISGPIESANGYKTMVAQFSWADGFQMRNINNYSVAWFNDVAGKHLVGESQFGQGVIPYQNQVLQVIAPYYQIQVKNTDSVVHNVNAWAYLMTN